MSTIFNQDDSQLKIPLWDFFGLFCDYKGKHSLLSTFTLRWQEIPDPKDPSES